MADRPLDDPRFAELLRDAERQEEEAERDARVDLLVELGRAQDAIDHAQDRWLRAADRATRERGLGVADAHAEPLAAFDPHGCFTYCLWGDDPQRPLYVGQSTNILARLGSHLGDGLKRPHIQRVTVTRHDGPEAMCRAEAGLIALHQPPWNRAGILPVPV